MCIEPTVFQYHGTFWSESLFFSFQIIMLALLTKKSNSRIICILIGIFLALLTLQKQMTIFYIIPLLLFYLYFEKKYKFKKISIILVSFFVIISLLGINNYYRSGQFYILTSDTKLNFYLYFILKVAPEIENKSRKEFDEKEGLLVSNWMDEKDISYDEQSKYLQVNRDVMNHRLSIINENDRVKFDNYISKRSLEIILENPLNYLKFVIKSSLHTILLNPFHIISDHKFRSGEVYYLSQMHDDLIKYRILYSILIFVICVLGFIDLFKKKNFRLLLLLIISLCYFYFLVSWHGNTRYFVPCLIYLSFFFGYGIENIKLNFYEKK